MNFCDDKNMENWKEVYVMKVLIERAANIIPFNDSFPYSLDRIKYGVIISDESGREFSTRYTTGMPTPEWNEEIAILFNNYPINQNLKLMVIRKNCYKDPGPSTGEAVVGRATIPIPLRLNTTQINLLELVTLVGLEKRVDAVVRLQTSLTKKHVISDFL